MESERLGPFRLVPWFSSRPWGRRDLRPWYGAEAFAGTAEPVGEAWLTGPESLGVVGADQVLTWQTGFPMAVNLAQGYPRFGPGEYSAAEVLSRGEADAALVVGSESLKSLPTPAVEHLARIRHVLITDQPLTAFAAASVAIRTAVPGVHSPGTFHRLDDVALGLRPVVASPLPHDFAILSALEQAVQSGSRSA